MTRVAFLGLGRMGAPMARRLNDAGHDIVVWNRTRSKAGGFAQVASSPVDAVGGAEIVITMLADADALRAVVFDSGLDNAMRMEAVFVDMSTIGIRANVQAGVSNRRSTEQSRTRSSVATHS